ncbi:hypothetical protein CP03DC29_0738B, partial [Chlamydia psittaci 03DC29]
DFMLIKLSKAI